MLHSQDFALIAPRTPLSIFSMHLVVIAWLYVTLMMSVAEASHSNGTVLGAALTFLLYGVAPIALMVYLMATSKRRRAMKAREAAAQDKARRVAALAALPSVEPDASSHAPAHHAIAPVREEP